MEGLDVNISSGRGIGQTVLVPLPMQWRYHRQAIQDTEFEEPHLSGWNPD